MCLIGNIKRVPLRTFFDKQLDTPRKVIKSNLIKSEALDNRLAHKGAALGLI